MERQGNYREKIISILKKIRLKKILLYACVAIIMLLPIQLAKYSQYKTQNQSNYFSVSLRQQNGTLIASEEGMVESAARYSLIDFFYNINANKKEVSNAPGDPSSDPYVVAAIKLNGAYTQLRCFFSLDGTADYLIDENENIYTISSLYTKHFITSPYAASFYSVATPPLLFSINNDTIAPSSINWNYKNVEEQFVTATSAQTVSEQRSYDITGEIGLYFEKEPTQASVSVYDNGTLIFQGDLSQLSTLSVNTKSVLNVKLTAVWKQNSFSDFFGTAQYDFLVRIQTPSHFSIKPDTASPGEWVLLSGTNISDPSKIRFEADWCETPVFCHSGSLTYALIPIPHDVTKVSLEFEVSYGASKQSFQIAIPSVAAKEPSLYTSDLLSPESFNEESLNASKSWISFLSQDRPYDYIFSTEFANPLESEFTVGYHHGDLIQTETGSVAELIGTEFVTSSVSPQSVSAWNHGKVVHVGSEQTLGNYVVVDHGCGLRIWYCHLGLVSVNIGDVVKQGDSLGLTSQNGISTANGFLVICTVNGQIVRPESIIGKTIIKSK